MAKRIGLREIAARLGVDASTVSRALRGDGRVAPATAERIRDVARELGYRPNVAAQALRGGRTGRVAVVLSPPQRRFASPIFLELLAALGDRLHETGRSLLALSAPTREAEPDLVRAVVEDHLADALVLGRTRPADPRVAYLLDAGVPFVTFGRTDWPGRHPVVDIDYRAAGRLAVEALAPAGPRSLGVLTGPEGLLFADAYLAGALEAAAALGLPAPRTTRAEITEEAGEAALGSLVTGPHEAVACIQDGPAFGVYRAAAARGLRVGRDLAVTGGQNIPGSEHVSPPLTTFSTQDAETADLLARTLVERLDGAAGGPHPCHIITPRAILRGSHRLGAGP